MEPDSTASQSGLSAAKRALLERWKRGGEGTAGAAGTVGAVPAIGRRTGAGPAPLALLQKQLWFLHQLDPGSAAYNVRAQARLAGHLDHFALRRALQDLVARHEILRTVFRTEDGAPVQMILSPPEVMLPRVELAALPPDRRNPEMRRLLREAAERPFDLEQGPLVRGLVAALATEEHFLLLNTHHIVFDGVSQGVMLRELGTLYSAFTRGEASPLRPLPVQYADFAAWQQREAAQGLEAGLAYWRRKLAGAAEDLGLPLDRPRPAVQRFRGASVPVAPLAPDLVEAVAALARREGTTLFTVLLAAFQTLLLRYTGQPDILVGTPVTGRHAKELEELIGLFINTVVLRGDLSGEPGFRTLVGRLRTTVLEAFDHQTVPFERLVEELGTDRTAGRNPLFQVVFAFHTTLVSEMSLPGLALRTEDAESTAAVLDFSLHLRERKGIVDGALELSTEIFDVTTAQRFAAQLAVLLAGAVEAPDCPLQELPLLPPAERWQALGEWNDAARDLPLGTGIVRLFREQAARTPEVTAAACEGDLLTYTELDRRSECLAGHLADLGAGEEGVVAVLSERGLDLLTAILALFKAGLVYLPLDPQHPAHRHVQVLRESRARAVLAAAELVPVAAEAIAALPACPRLLPFPDLSAGSTAPAPVHPFPDPAPQRLAYVIFTSGSTGVPKGAMMEHQGMLNHLFAKIDQLGLTAADTVAQTASQCFDISIWQFLAALMVGGRVEIFPNEVTRNPVLLLEETRRQGVTILETIPSLLRALVDEVAPGTEVDPEVGGGLRWMIPTGEALPPDLCNRWLRLFPHIPLVNAYGPTECSDDVTHCVLRHPLPQDAVTVPIGRPVVNLRLHVVSRAFHCQPVGVPGELCVGGIGVGRGYLNDPLRTAAVFVPDPFAETWNETGARLYRTGDLARWLPAGELEFLGRIDHQVKIRGFRIELGEIEAVLARHPAVRECVVLAREDAAGSRFLAAYLAARGEEPPVAELIDFLRRHIPEYMVPSAFVILPALPLTANGKVDRKVLPAPERSRDEGTSFVPPGDPVEELLAGVWAEVLGIERIGVHDDFFALGGHSLQATQVRSRIRGLLGVDLPLRTLFEATTLGRLAREVRAARQAGGEAVPSAIPPLPPAARDGALPLSFAQQRLWLIDQLDPGSAAYNLPTAVRVTGELRPGLLDQVFAALVRRHESLRTTFAAREGKPVQVIAALAPHWCPELPTVDLSALPEARREELARALTLDEARRPFDLQSGPLLRLALLRLADEDHLLLLTLHHIVSDGWSWGVLLRDVAALTTALSQSLPATLPELRVQYADFAVWQRDWLRGEVLEAQLAYWKQQLAGAPLVLQLPADRPRPAVPRQAGGLRPVALPAGLLEGVAALCRNRGVTHFMALLAAWSVLLGRHANQDDVLVGTPIAGRNQQEVEDLIGFFINTLVLRTEWGRAAGFGDLLLRVRDVAIEAFTHQSLPFERLVDEIAPDRDLSRPPVFQSMFVLQNAPLGVLALPGLTLRQIPVDGGVAKFDLTLNLAENAGGRSFLEYNADVFDGTTAERLMTRYETLLAAALAEPDRPLWELPLLPAAERWQTLGEWDDTAVAYASGVSLHELVAAQAERTPDAVAAVFAGESLTYRDLLVRSRNLARHLVALGVEADGRVGVFLERSLEMIVGLLGILEAGAAYVPLDPALPEERLRSLVESAGITVALTADTPALPPLPGVAAVRVIDEAQGAAGGSSGPVRRTADGNLAYVIYTSGSTGTPKGVMIPHRGIVNRLLWMQEAYGLGAADRVLQKTPFSFDVSVWELFWPLLTGARLVFARPEGHKDPFYLAELIAAEGITTLHFVPSMLQAFLAAPGLEELTSVRRVMASGEALPPELVRQFFARMPHAGLHNLYGPTEASVDVSFWNCEPEPPRGQVPIGRPIANHHLHVVDRHLEPQPIGVHGELLLGGPGLARGYLGRPDLTAAAFVPDPFGNGPGERLYRTGDLVCHLPDGNVSYLGRIDHQVKVRGFRIELGEIETVLASHPDVQECVVTAHQDGPGDKRLIAYLVLGPDPALQHPESGLAAFLGTKLPAYMIPAVFVVLPAFPLSPNGKIDRKALQAPARQAAVRTGAAPRTPAELTLARIWGEILRVEQVSLDDNFFALGGDSILSIQVAFRAREAGLALAPRDLFLHRNLGDLAAAVPAAIDRVAGELDEMAGDLPLTPVQHWFFALDLSEPHHFNQALLLTLRERIEPPRLEAALAALVERHTALRLRFLRREGGGWQQRAAGTVVPVERVDLSRLPEALRRPALEEAAALLQASLHLEAGPLLRAALFDLGAAGQRLFLVLHHLIVDGVSWRILLADLEAACRALAAGSGGADLLPVGTSLGRWGARLAAEARAGSAAEELGFWLQQVRDIPPLPVAWTGGENTVASARRLVAELDEETTRALLQDVPAAYRTQINDVLLTSLAQAFAGWTGAERLLVDLEGHGREELFDGVDLSRTVGWLTAIYPVVLELDRRERNPGERLKSVKEQLRQIPRKGLGHGILGYLGDEATAAALRALPAPQVAFNYLGQLDRGLPEGSLFALAPESVGEPYSPRQRRPWLLEISGGVMGGRLRLTWTYSESFHDARTIQGVIDHFLSALRELIEHCRTSGEGGITPSDFPAARANQKDLDKLMARIGGRRR
jgi:amino acid adenylation domain-containing protein/non-ribosomal peptide synthase protein (TIGR01720 family)